MGYAGKLLRIDLTRKKAISEILSEDLAHKFIGGSGLAARILFDEVEPSVDPFSPDNVIVFMTGPLTGTTAPCCGRYAVVSKSPLTGIWGEAGSAGFWGPELKFAGYDGIVIKGKSETPLYLWIRDSTVEFKDARGIWGMDTCETQTAIREELGERHARVARIGPAGEMLSRIACIFNDEMNAAGRCGLGAVMGSKNLKAVAVHGSGRVKVADESRFMEKVKGITSRIISNPRTANSRKYGTAGGLEGTERIGDLPIKNWMLGSWPEGAARISGEHMAETMLKRAATCFSCPIGCKRDIEVRSGPYGRINGHGPEYETCAAFGSMLLNDDLVAIAKANDLCTRYGLDTISCGAVIAFCTECYSRGLLTQKDTDGLDLAWGNSEAFVKLVEMIGRREGIGRLLGEGTRLASRKIMGSDEFAIHVKGLELPMHDPRAYESLALGYATSNRGGCHLQAASHWVESGALFPELGIETKPDRFSSVGKPNMVASMQNLMSLCDSLIICKFALTRGFQLQDVAEIVSIVTGSNFTFESLIKAGERIFNLKRVFNIRLGISRKDDILPNRILRHSLSDGGTKGHVPDLEHMLDEYYRIRGWDEMGRPKESKLDEISLADIAFTRSHKATRELS